MHRLALRIARTGRLIRFVPALVITAGSAAADTIPTPIRLVEDSIAHHDPHGIWTRCSVQLVTRTVYSEALATSRGRSERSVEIRLRPGRGDFGYVDRSTGDVVEYSIKAGESRVLLNGSDEISEEDRTRLRIRTPELYRDYCEYVYGLPMKLCDPGTRLPAVVEHAEFDGRKAWVLRITYDPEVGSDVWYFYFDPATSALVGSRFFHDEAKKDGEYIVYEGEVHDPASGLRLPGSHAWYTNADDGHLATDTITSLRVDSVDP